MKPRQKILAGGLALLLCGSMIPVSVNAAAFSDVGKNSWAYSDIMAMECRGLIQGRGGKFHPAESVSNQAFLAMVCRATGLDDRSMESPWTAEPIMAYGKYWGWFDDGELTKENGIAPITREFAAQLLVKGLFPEEMNGETTISFTDQEQITPDRLPYVQVAAELGLITGYEDGTFRPQEPLTRAAAAALLNRALQKSPSMSKGKSVRVPILMYHDVSYLGRGYSKTPEIFRRQMQELKNAGFHTVTYRQLVDFVEQGVPLPEKPVVISVDDGYHSNYEYLYPILQELDMKAEIALIGGAIDFSSWGLKWDEVREMEESGLVCFQAHSYQMHGDHSKEGGRLGVMRAPGESWAQYLEVLGKDSATVMDRIEAETGVRPVAFVYPRGRSNAMADAMVGQLGCKASVTTKSGIAKITQGDPKSLRRMDRIGMDFRNGSVVAVLKEFGY